MFDTAAKLVWLPSAGELALPRVTTPVPCTLLVPSERVLSERWSLPQLRRRDALRAIPFQLEERTLEELAQLQVSIHALGRGQYQVWAIAREWLQTQLHALAALGYQVTRVLPDYWRVPVHADAWSVWVEAERAWVRTDAWHGLVVPLAQLTQVLSLLQQAQAANSLSVCHSYGLSADAVEALSAELRCDWQWHVHTLPDSPVSLHDLQPRIGNLLSPTATVQAQGQPSVWWQRASVAVLCAGAVSLAVMLSEWCQQAADLRSVQRQLTLPSVSTPAQAWQLVRQTPTIKISELPWLNTLRAIAAVMQQAEGVQLLSLRAEGDLWHVTVMGYRLSALTAVKTNFQQQGLDVASSVIHTGQRVMRAEFTIRGHGNA